MGRPAWVGSPVGAARPLSGVALWGNDAGPATSALELPAGQLVRQTVTLGRVRVWMMRLLEANPMRRCRRE